MQTSIFRMDNNKPDIEALKQCARSIKSGGIVAFPTETVYGLGANAFDKDACENVFKAKNRPPDKPLILHLSDNINPEDFAVINESYLKLKKAFPSGPLTFILPLKIELPNIVTAGGDTIAFRFPENTIARKLIEFSGVPIAAPSANISGKEPPRNAKGVIEDFFGKADYIIDGGKCNIGTPSTIISLVGEPTILRQGAIPADEVLKCL